MGACLAGSMGSTAPRTTTTQDGTRQDSRPQLPPTRDEADNDDIMPCVYLNHGGGPMPLLGQQPSIADFLRGYPATLPRRPRAVLVITAHWETAVPTVSTAAQPPLYFDYGGFPPKSYKYRYPAPGAQDVAARVRDLLGNSGLTCATDSKRGWDHGVFVPMMLMFPEADVPICAMSLRDDQDAAAHLQLGEALQPLRKEGVLLVGSGASFHNFGYFFAKGDKRKKGERFSQLWDEWLRRAITDDSVKPAERFAALADWRRAAAPAATEAHPVDAAEHLVPIFVMCGAGGCAPGTAIETGESNPGGIVLGQGIAVSQFEWRR